MKKTSKIFFRFLGLGLMSFGGPAAHMGYFHKMFVQRLKWLDEDAYARLIALCQFLPGPASSQVGFAIGLRRGGVLGGLAAFLGFTIPSFLLMYVLSVYSAENVGVGTFGKIAYGLKLLAVIVVADACLNMFNAFCKRRLTTGICIFTAALLLWLPSLWTQILLLGLAALVGATFHKLPSTKKKATKSSSLSKPSLIVFLLLFLGLPFFSFLSQSTEIFSQFYQAGSLVFGGGHVVLPLLQQILGESISTDRFLIGYAAAQAVPGPMFSFASFLGAELFLENPLLGALLATGGVFLPGFLLVYSLHGIWESLASKPRLAGAAGGINAAVVGLLLSAFYKPVFLTAVKAPSEMALVFIGFFCLRFLKLPVLALVLAFGSLGFIF